MVSIGIVFVLFLFLYGCTEPNVNNGNGNNGAEYDELIIGLWNTTEPIPWYIKPEFEFFADKRFDVQGFGGTYAIDKETLTLTWDDQGKTFVYDYEFIDQDTLRLTYLDTNDSGIYTRK